MICSRREFYISKGFFFLFLPTVAKLIQHYDDDARTTPTWGYQLHLCEPMCLYSCLTTTTKTKQKQKIKSEKFSCEYLLLAIRKNA